MRLRGLGLRLGMSVLALVLAFAFAGAVASLILVLTGDDVASFWSVMTTWPQARDQVDILNTTAVLYLSGAAAAIGFRMNLFNIGVEGQYRIAGFAAASFAAVGLLPGALNVIASILVAMLVGAAWAGIAGLLRVTRGVSEVISTIMLNSIAGILIGYFITRLGVSNGKSTNTKTMPKDTWLGSLHLIPGVSDDGVYLLALLAPAVAIAFLVLVYLTRFGFDLRAAGSSESAAVASGVNVRTIVVVAMLLSGAVAALIGLPEMFSSAHNYGSSFQTGLGFTGIAVALLGRNHPIGIGFGALIFAYLGQQSTLLNILAGVSPDIVAVTQGVIVLAVVVAFELTRRFGVRLEQRQVAAQLSGTAAPARPEPKGAEA